MSESRPRLIEFGIELYRETSATARYEIVCRSSSFSFSLFHDSEQAKRLLEKGLLEQRSDFKWETYAVWTDQRQVYVIMQQFAGLDRKNRVVAKRLYFYFDQGWNLAEGIVELIGDVDRACDVQGEAPPKQVLAERLTRTGPPIDGWWDLEATEQKSARRIAARLLTRVGPDTRIVMAYGRQISESSSHFSLLSESNLESLLQNQMTPAGTTTLNDPVENEVGGEGNVGESVRLIAVRGAPVKTDPTEENRKAIFLVERRESSRMHKSSLMGRFLQRGSRESQLAAEFSKVNRALMEKPKMLGPDSYAREFETFWRLWLKWQECLEDNRARFEDALDSSPVGDMPEVDLAALLGFIRSVVRQSEDRELRESLRSFSKWVLEYILEVEIPVVKD